MADIYYPYQFAEDDLSNSTKDSFMITPEKCRDGSYDQLLYGIGNSVFD